MLCICPDRRPAFGSCREGVCTRPDRRPAFGYIHACMFVIIIAEDM